MPRWKPTKYEGVRYREHPTRKHGIRPDRYFAIRLQINGRRHEEGVGWESEGWTASKAATLRAELKRAATTGDGPVALAEKRRLAEERRQREEAERRRRELEEVTFAEFFQDNYLPWTTGNGKSARSLQRERSLFRLWLAPVIGDLLFGEISPFHIEKIKATMLKAGRALRSVQYALALVRQVWNRARDAGIHDLPCPTRKVKLDTKKHDNRRIKFLTREEAAALLAECRRRSANLHDMALLSLHCGLRAGEIFGLTWADVDITHGLVVLRDTKSGRTRSVPMTEAVRTMFCGRERGKPTDLVFPARDGGRIEQISNAFDQAVKALGLNEGVTDRRQRVVFHTLRHTYASWLVAAGTDLYTVQRLLGHQSIALTERYAHLAPDTLKAATQALEQYVNDTPPRLNVVPGGRGR